MQNHEHFEELCALAAVGQLSADEYGELEIHLTDCGACQETLRDMAVVTDSWVPATPLLDHGVSTVRLRSTSSLRENFIARARDRGLNLTRQSETRSGIWAQWPFYRIKPYLAATAVAVFVVSITFFLIRIDHRTRQVTNQAQALGTHLGALQHENASLKQEIAAEQQIMASRLTGANELEILRKERDGAAAKATALEISVSALTKDRDQLQKQLIGTRAELAVASQNYSAVNRDLTSVQAEITAARAASMEDRALLASQQKKIDELSQRPTVENTALEREHELLAADRDIRELMGARNLHIIDVHDRDSKGKARRSFGRVFYTEGKSLIFYAFDLSEPKLKNASFQAWGHKEDGSKKAVSLGLFFMDDKQQSRWVLRFNDPAVLAEIDSVFVTVEPPGGRKDPSGEKLLYAFLNFDANHP
jgi:anti-sigma-K factor RskA